jgi:hypothetical protein
MTQLGDEKGRAKTGGRRKGSPNKGTERARRLISEADDKAIVDRVVREAKVNSGFINRASDFACGS